ncbi:MAG: GMC family oxidoreductase [Desulfobacterales bacterium]
MNRRVCVIGTGMGGGSFITRYTSRHNDLVVVEAGSDNESTLIRSQSAGRAFGLNATRSIALGGTSNIWRGLCGPLDPIDFIRRPWIPHSGWPIGSNDLKPYYKEACRMLGLPALAWFSPLPSNRRVRSLVGDMDFDRLYHANKFFIHKEPPKNFKHDLLRLFKHGEHLLLLNTVAVEVVSGDTGNSVQKIIARDPRGHAIEIYAKYFVIAAGALETPRLMLNSGRWRRSQNGDMVGRCLMDHPMGSLSQIRLDRIRKAPLYHAVNIALRQKLKTGLVLKEEWQRRCRLPNHCFYLWPSFRRGIDDRFENLRRSLITSRKKKLGKMDIVTLLSHPNTAYRLLSYILPIDALYQYADLFFVTEQIPNPQSRVSLADETDRYGYPVAKINWVLSDPDLDSIARYNDLALRAFSFNGNQVTFRKQPAQIGPTVTSAAHHLGTARMSASPRDGVVDRDLKVWNVDNLYIGDASVFPTSGNANPALTICALSIRLADHLSQMP